MEPPNGFKHETPGLESSALTTRPLLQYTTVHSCDFSITHGGENDINKHNSTPKQKQFFDSTQNQKKVNRLGCKYSNSQFRRKSNKIGTTAGLAQVSHRNFHRNYSHVNRAVSKQTTDDLKEE